MSLELEFKADCGANLRIDLLQKYKEPLSLVRGGNQNGSMSVLQAMNRRLG
jgi:hypothetical protein